MSLDPCTLLMGSFNCLAKATVTLSKNPWCYPWQLSNTRKERRLALLSALAFHSGSSLSRCPSCLLLSFVRVTHFCLCRWPEQQHQACVGCEWECVFTFYFIQFFTLVAVIHIFDFVKHLLNQSTLLTLQSYVFSSIHCSSDAYKC